jgi:predicted NBD/HSP70 family sugar kinase
MQILRVIRENGAISRVDLSDFLQITRAAVTIITNEMIAQGILEEVGEAPVDPYAETRKGRRKILLDINPTYRFALGAYIDSDNISIGMTTLNAATMDKRTISITATTSMEEIVKVLCENARKMMEDSCLTSERIVGMGIGVMPSMWQVMGVRENRDGLDFSRLIEAVSQELDVRVFCGNAISLFAVASNRYQEHLGAPLNQVLLYAAENGYHIAVLYRNDLRDEFQRDTQVADALCVKPDGRALTGYCRGSVKAELTPQAIAEKVSSLYGAEPNQTPALYMLTAGQCSAVTMAQVLTALDEGDEVLRPIVTELLDEFCLMLNNLEHMFFARHISLYKFGFTEQHLTRIRERMEWMAGAEAAEKIVLCDIEERYHFLSGCAYAIQNGFFHSGGMGTLDLEEEEEKERERERKRG